MRNVILFSFFATVFLLSCKKDEPRDLSYLCSRGDLWLTNNTDSFNPNHSYDSFFFNQGAGFHRFVFTNSPVNRLQIDVLVKPTIGQTIQYKKQFVKEISGKIILNDFVYTNNLDTVLTITNLGDRYIVDIKSIPVYTSNNTKYDLKVCGLKMTDTIP